MSDSYEQRARERLIRLVMEADGNFVTELADLLQAHDERDRLRAEVERLTLERDKALTRVAVVERNNELMVSAWSDDSAALAAERERVERLRAVARAARVLRDDPAHHCPPRLLAALAALRPGDLGEEVDGE